MNKIKFVFNMTLLIEILKVYSEKQLLIEKYVIKRLILPKIHDISLMSKKSSSMIYIFFDKKTSTSNTLGGGVKSEIVQNR